MGVPFIRSMNVVFFGFKREGLAYLDERQAAALENVEVRSGDVLLNITGASIGRVTIAPSDMDGARVNQHVCIIRPVDGLDGRYLRAFLSSPTMQDTIGAENYGVTRQALTKQQILDFQIPLAPINEQKRIADKLDAVLARVDACRERLDRVPAILKRFRQAVLAAAISGTLSEEWRQAQRLSMESWQQTVFEKVCKDITVGHVGKMAAQYRDSGIPFLRSLNVRPFRFDSQEIKYISPEFHRSLAKSALRPGDVVVVRTGAPGQCCVIPQELPEANCSDLVIVRPGPDLSAAFAAVFINSETSQAFVKAEQVGVAQAHFNVGSMKRAPLLLPSLLEQDEIVRRVDALFVYADNLEARYTAARAQVEDLTPALLAKAFRGELVPQDRGRRARRAPAG
jgi:type I restriction enzyme S subunit